jgi:hypothetical protein
VRTLRRACAASHRGSNVEVDPYLAPPHCRDPRRRLPGQSRRRWPRFPSCRIVRLPTAPSATANCGRTDRPFGRGPVARCRCALCLPTSCLGHRISARSGSVRSGFRGRVDQSRPGWPRRVRCSRSGWSLRAPSCRRAWCWVSRPPMGLATTCWSPESPAWSLGLCRWLRVSTCPFTHNQTQNGPTSRVSARNSKQTIRASIRN